jgi:hypothetical protein
VSPRPAMLLYEWLTISLRKEEGSLEVQGGKRNLIDKEIPYDRTTDDTSGETCSGYICCFYGVLHAQVSFINDFF